MRNHRKRHKVAKRNVLHPDRMHPQGLRMLAEVTAKLLSIIFERRSWRMGEVPEGWRKTDVTKGKKEDL